MSAATLNRWKLSERELQIMGLLADGFRARDIAPKLFLSPCTVQTHIARAAKKMGAPHNHAAMMMFARNLAAGDMEYTSWRRKAA